MHAGLCNRAVFFISIKHIILFFFHLRQHTQASAQPPTDFGLGHHGDPLQVQLKNQLDCIGLSCLFCAAWWLCSDDSLLWGQCLVCSGCAKCSVIGTLDGRQACSSLVDEMGFRKTRRHSASEILLKILRRRRSSAMDVLTSSSQRVIVALSMSEAQTDITDYGCNVSCLSWSYLVWEEWILNPNFSSSVSTVNVRVPTAKYTKVGETLRHVIPGHMQCSMACGGRACKYENPSRWSDKEQAIKGLYSSW